MITLSLVELSKKVDRLIKKVCCLVESSGVSSVFGRSGAIVADPGDYSVLTNLTINNSLIDVTGTMLGGFFQYTVQNNITAGTGGAIPVTNYFTTINSDAGGDAFTLADGLAFGQRKRIRFVVDGGGDAVLTPANLANGNTITFNDAGDDVELIWTGLGWVVIANIGAVVA